MTPCTCHPGNDCASAASCAAAQRVEFGDDMTTPKPAALPERFTKKPVTIEAVQFTEALRDAIVLDGVPCPEGVKRGATTWHQKDRKVWRADFFIDTLEGRMNVEIGDWIIRGVKGELYPCKPDIFEMTYDRAALQAQPAAAVSDEAARLAEQLSNIANGVRICGVHDRHFVSNRLHEIARAILALRPQAVPMARAQRLEVFRKAEDRMAHDINLCWRNALIEETEAHHGITQRADGGEG